MHYQRRMLTGKAYLETDYILLAERSASGFHQGSPIRHRPGWPAAPGIPGGPAVLGNSAPPHKWAHKIPHLRPAPINSASSPVSRSPGRREFNADFDELRRGRAGKSGRLDLSPPGCAALGQIPNRRYI
jgi:hypothetical protein